MNESEQWRRTAAGGAVRSALDGDYCLTVSRDGFGYIWLLHKFDRRRRHWLETGRANRVYNTIEEARTAVESALLRLESGSGMSRDL